MFFTADEDRFYAPAEALWGARLRTHRGGGVFMPWSTGRRVEAGSLSEGDEAAVVKALVDWFALQASRRIVYTHQSSFGKTAAESADVPNTDVNFTRCAQAEAGGRRTCTPYACMHVCILSCVWHVHCTSAQAEADGRGWADEREGAAITYDVSRVPGAR